MLPLTLAGPGRPLSVLAIGAHPDDIEIGCGGTLLRLADEMAGLTVHVAVCTSTPERATEANLSAKAFLAPAEHTTEVHALVDGHLPAQWAETKSLVEDLAARTRPDVVLAPSPQDAHQDHRLLGELVPTAFRDHLVLHYEIPKWDGDLGAARPTHYVPLSAEHVARKYALLWECFASQRGRDWFTDETFRALARLRGMECRAAYAEAFSVGKAVLSFTP
ncbi:MAG: PIG-L deacetylase family protein [Actinomycetes bacterium]